MPTDPVIVYGHNNCPGIPPALAALNKARAPYQYVNIHRDEEARERVRTINSGMESVPTLVFPDGSTLTEPSRAMLKRTLRAHGYRIPPLTWLASNTAVLIAAALLIIVLLRLLGVI